MIDDHRLNGKVLRRRAKLTGTMLPLDFAEASKHNLSREETDLIEITLNNLFAVDKLLHLLRSRKKKLSLVDLRLK